MSEPTAELHVRLRSRIEETGRLATVVEGFGAAHELPEHVVFALSLSLDEVVTNIVSYAFDDVEDHAIDISLRLLEDLLEAEVTDHGRPFNPFDAPAPELDAPVEARPIGGLGIHLVREMMDTMDYRREAGANVLLLKKRITSAG